MCELESVANVLPIFSTKKQSNRQNKLKFASIKVLQYEYRGSILYHLNMTKSVISLKKIKNYFFAKIIKTD